MKLIGTMIGSEQPKVLGEFYTKILGEPGWQQDDWYGFRAGDGNLMIGSHSEVHGQNVAPARIMLSFVVDNVQVEFDRIKGLGATVVAEPYQPSGGDSTTWLATLADPDGNYLQLATPWEEPAKAVD